MSQTYLLLQKKLHELESEFTHLNANYLLERFRPNPVADEFHNRLVFLRNLLTAEIALHPVKPDPLVQIEGRLVELEAALGRGYTHTIASSSDAGDNINGDDELVSSWSLNDGGDQDEVVGFYDVPDKFINEEVVQPPEPKKTFGYDQYMQSYTGDNRKETGSYGGGYNEWRREYFRVLAFWMMLLGAILMVNFQRFFHIV